MKVEDLGFRASGSKVLGFAVWGLGKCLGFRVQGSSGCGDSGDHSTLEGTLELGNVLYGLGFRDYKP